MWANAVLVVTFFCLIYKSFEDESKTNLRIIGGQVADIESFPYQVGISIKEPTWRIGWCGGALISPEFILTAAHCLKRVQLATLFIGTHDVRNLSSNSNTITLDVTPRNMFIHHLWTPRYAVNDIALIRLPEPIPLSDFMRPISLPYSHQKNSALVIGQTLVATGWGRTSRNRTIPRPSQLHSVKLRVEPDVTCEDIFPYYNSTVNICLEGNTDKTTCFGDSGGPIVAANEKSGTHVLVGITSYGKKCENVSVLTRVASYLNWIIERTGVL